MRGVFAGMASFGNRIELLRQAVTSLLGQVDRLGVYLNNYDEVPTFLDEPRIVVARSQDHGDQRDNGKFFFLEQSDHRFYAAVDDDLIYPPDYIDRLLGALADAGPNAAVGVHGAIYPTRILGLAKPRTLFHYRDPLPYVVPVHLLGTGTVLFDQQEWKLRFEEFEEPGMADVWFARSSARREARLFVVNRNKDWLNDVAEPASRSTGGLRLFAEARVDDSRQVDLLRSGGVAGGGYGRLIRSLASGPGLAAALSLSQAVFLDEVRRDLGWPPLSQAAAAEVESLLLGSRSNWSDGDRITDDEVESYTRASIGVLSDDLAADTLAGALRVVRQALTLEEEDPGRWQRLPHPIRFDSRRARFYRLRPQLVRRSYERSDDDALELWNQPVLTGAVDLDLALRAERAGADTSFQHLPQLKETARENWLQAALHLRSYFEERSFRVQPDALAWRRAFGERFGELEIQILLCWLFSRSGQSRAARAILEDLRRSRPAEPEVAMLEATLEASGTRGVTRLETALAPVDRTLEGLGLTPYRNLLDRTRDPGSGWLELLSAEPTVSGGTPEVSVILTAFNASQTVLPAMRSVLASRGVEVQLIVVDDGSDDGTAALARDTGDDRVVVLQNSSNLGPYGSRNLALQVAEGRFVTIADADDWTHPDRIRFQVDRLTERPHLWACTVAHIRLLADGLPDLENHLRFIGHGPVSLLMRREVVDHIGYFDHVRTRGDIEFIRRLRARFGWEAIQDFEVPLVLASSSGSSNSKRFTDDTLGRYRRAMREWHMDNALSDKLYVGPTPEQRAGFLAPHELLVAPDAEVALEIGVSPTQP